MTEGWGDGGWGEDPPPDAQPPAQPYGEPWHQQPGHYLPDVHGFPAPPRPWRRRQQRALWYGIWSLVVVGCMAVALVAGILTFFAGGFLLLLLLAPLGVVACVLALLSIGSAVRAEGAPVVTRVLVTVPAWLTIAALLPAVRAVLPDSRPFSTARQEPAPAVRGLARDATPEEVVDEAARLLWMGRFDEFCALLARSARTEGCARDVAFSAEFEMAHPGELVRRSATRAIVSVDPLFDDSDLRHRVRLVREAEGWQLLDVPGRAAECVAAAKDPFTCPVHRHGSTPE